MGFGGGSGSSSISGASDAAMSNPANGDVVTYNSTLNKWQNLPAAVASDASMTVKGVIMLAGDLGGTAALPTVPGLANKAIDASVVHLANAETITGAKTFSASPVVPDGSFAQTATTGLVTALSGKQPSSNDLTAIAGLIPTDNDVLQRKSGAWINRTPIQLKTDLALTATDVGLSNVTNTSDANKPISTATQTALSGKQPSSNDLTAIAGLIPTGNDVLQRKSGAWINRTPIQLKTDLALTATDVGLSNVTNTSDANKPISTATQTALSGKEPVVTAGTASQYYRGDKTWQTLDKTAVGLANVDNTSDVSKPVSTATQTALNLKADATTVGTKALLITNAAALPAGTPAGVIVVVQS
jgi:hypothetical protein